METDTLEHAIGEVLSQEQDGKWKPITFLLRTMQPAEWNYEIYDKKLLAAVRLLQNRNNTCWMPQRNSKPGQTIKNSSIFKNHSNLMDDKWGGTWNYRTMISYYNTFLEKWAWKPMFYQERATSIPQKTIKMYKCLRMKCE